MRSNPRRLASHRVSGRALITIATCLVLVTALGSSSSASLSSKLDSAKEELDNLTAKIATQEARAQDLQGQVSVLASQIVTAKQREDAITGELVATQREMDAAAQRAAQIQADLDEMAQAMYMQGGDSLMLLDPLVSSTSISDLNDRLAYAQAVGQSSADLAAQVASARAALAYQADQLTQLASQKRAFVTELDHARMAKAQALDAEHQTIVDLEQTKSEIVALITKLHREIRAQALAQVADAFQGGGHITYGAWAGLFLRTIGVSDCQSNKVVVVAWQYSEFTQAAWNPLATTHVMPGSTDFNSVGVQNYPSLQVGLQATKETIDGGSQTYGYGAIVASLRRCADPMTTAQAINASAWCAGCVYGTYVIGVVPKVEADYDLYAQL